jgi:hypothetical protein
MSEQIRIFRTGRELYVRWSDKQGLEHTTELDLLLEYCHNGKFGLSEADAARFRVAHDRYVLELEQGHPLPFEGPIHRVGGGT